MANYFNNVNMDSQRRVEEQQAAFENSVQNQQEVPSNNLTSSQEQISGLRKYDKKKAVTLFYIFGFPGYFYLHKWGMAILCVAFTVTIWIPALIIGIIKGNETNNMSEEEFHKKYE